MILVHTYQMIPVICLESNIRWTTYFGQAAHNSAFLVLFVSQFEKKEMKKNRKEENMERNRHVESFAFFG